MVYILPDQLETTQLAGKVNTGFASVELVALRQKNAYSASIKPPVIVVTAGVNLVQPEGAAIVAVPVAVLGTHATRVATRMSLATSPVGTVTVRLVFVDTAVTGPSADKKGAAIG
jgi:hypothetical protein